MSQFVRVLTRSAGVCSILLLLIFAGCTPVLQEGMENHIIAADYLGEPAFFDTVDAQGNVVRYRNSVTLPEHLKRMKEQIAKSGRKKIMIYCFGGMNTFEETIRASEKLTQIIEKDSPDIYPIFVNWDSALFGCYLEDLFYIRQGFVQPVWGPPTAPLFLAQHIVESMIRLPADMISQAQGISSLYADEMFIKVNAALRDQKTQIDWYMGEDRSDHKWDTLIRLGYASGLPFRVMTSALINTFGRRGWQEMRRRARLAFVKDPRTTSELKYALSMFRGQQDGVFADFVEMLIEYTREHPDTEITLIGHCMGTIIATEFLSRYSDLPVKNIVFMAGASSVQETSAVVRPYLQRHPQSHFYNLCLHPRIDWYDMMDYMVLPCGSVLVWANEHLTEPLSKEDYAVGLWGSSIVLLPRMMTGVEKQITLKGFGIDDPLTSVGKDMRPYQHTDFNHPSVRFWRKEFWQNPAEKKTHPAL